MTRDDVLDLCAALPGAVEDHPFGEGVAVFKVGGRMFALIPLEGNPGNVNLQLRAYRPYRYATDAKIPVLGWSRRTGIFASHGEPSGGLYVADLIDCRAWNDAPSA